LFDEELDYVTLRKIVEVSGVNKTSLSERFDRSTFLERHGPGVVPLVAVRDGRLLVNVIDAPTPLFDRLQAGDVVLWVNRNEIDDGDEVQDSDVDRLESP
jgi:hypothetical protein